MFRMENPQISAGKYDVNTAKKSFRLRISSVNVTKFAVNCGFSLIY